jgi:hypothetical protein
MANFLDLLAFYALIAAQFLAAVSVYQYRTGFPSWHDSTPRPVALIRYPA